MMTRKIRPMEARHDPPQKGDDGTLDYRELPGYLGYQIRRTQSWIFERFMEDLGDLDLTPGAFGMLTLIRANPGITQMQLSRAFGIDKSTLSPVLARLERRGLIRRAPMAHDRRFNALRIAPQGEAQLDALLHRLAGFEGRMTARLGPEKAAQLISLLVELREGDGAAG